MSTVRIKQNEYNVGALSGKYALRDMSNTGKFSNIIEALPLKATFDIDRTSGTLTLKQGSLLTVPFGFSDADGVTPVTHFERIAKDISTEIGHKINDYSIEPTTDEKVYVVYNYAAGILEADKNIDYEYFAENVIEDGKVKYEGNTFLRVSSKSKCALPLGYFDDAWHFHQFTAIGFYKGLMWVDSGVKYDVPYGRNDDYTLNVDAVSISNTVYTTVAEIVTGTTIANDFSGFLFLDTAGKALVSSSYKSSSEYSTLADYMYVTGDNYILDRNQEIAKICKISNITIKNNKFDSISGFNTYQQLDFTDVSNTIAEITNKVIFKNGEDQTVDTNITFNGQEVFNNILVKGGDITNCGVSGSLNVTGKVSLVDADIASVRKAAHPDCFAVIGKSNTNRGGIVFGADNSIHILANESDASITVKLPTNKVDANGNAITPQILPDVTGAYDIGTEGQAFRNVYAQNFRGRATTSGWADLAEVYKTDKNYPIGTLLQFGGKEEMTIASNEVNAVVSEAPGVLLNAEAEGQPVALAGRVKVLIDGKINKHGKVFLSAQEGIGTAVGFLKEQPIGRALEEKTTDGIGLVLCAVHFKV